MNKCTECDEKTDVGYDGFPLCAKHAVRWLSEAQFQIRVVREELRSTKEENITLRDFLQEVGEELSQFMEHNTSSPSLEELLRKINNKFSGPERYRRGWR